MGIGLGNDQLLRQVKNNVISFVVGGKHSESFWQGIYVP